MERKLDEEQHESSTVNSEDEEALSLSELPLMHDIEETENVITYTQEDFDFCTLPKQPEMCAADDVFFQGQLLPLQCAARPVSISGSDNSVGFSSSRSSSSGSSTTTIRRPTPPPRTSFQGITGSSHGNLARKSSVWDILKLGLLTAPTEAPFLKTRSPSNTKTNGGEGNSDKKRKPKNIILGGCKCSSAVAVDGALVKRSQVRQQNNYTDVGRSPATKKQLSHRRTFEWLKQLQLSIEDPPSSSFL